MEDYNEFQPSINLRTQKWNSTIFSQKDKHMEIRKN